MIVYLIPSTNEIVMRIKGWHLFEVPPLNGYLFVEPPYRLNGVALIRLGEL